MKTFLNRIWIKTTNCSTFWNNWNYQSTNNWIRIIYQRCNACVCFMKMLPKKFSLVRSMTHGPWAQWLVPNRQSGKLFDLKWAVRKFWPLWPPILPIQFYPNGYLWTKNMFPPGLEPGTFRVLGERDNHYTTETLCNIGHVPFLYSVLPTLMDRN